MEQVNTKGLFGKLSRRFKRIYNPRKSINRAIVAILSIAAAIGNTIGFLANFLLYGINIPTLFCAACAVVCILNLIFGTKSDKYMIFGSVMLAILCALEFPLLTFAYGSVMYPYMILGFVGVLILANKKIRATICTCLLVFDVAVIAMSSLNPFIFGPQDSVGLMGSAIVTFLVSMISITVCILTWQSAYVRRNTDMDPITGQYSQIGFVSEFVILFPRIGNKGNQKQRNADYLNHAQSIAPV